MQYAASMSATTNCLNQLQMDSPFNLSNKLTPSGSKRNLSTLDDNQTPKAKGKRGRRPKIKKGFSGIRPPSSASSNNDEEIIDDNKMEFDNGRERIPCQPVYEPPGFELPVNHQIVTDENKVQLMPPPLSTDPIKRGRGRPRKSLDLLNEPQKAAEIKPQKSKERSRPPSERIEVDTIYNYATHHN